MHGRRRYTSVDTTQDYYQLLHVMPDAPAPVIKASYRAMMQKLRHHPDLGGDPALAQLLNLAAETLCDPTRRARYDKQLRVQQARTSGNTENPRHSEGAAAATTGAAGNNSSRGDPGGNPHGRTRDTPDAGRQQKGASGTAGDASRESTRDAEDGSTQERRADGPTSRPGAAEHRPEVLQTRLPARPHCLFCGATRASATAIRQPYEAARRCLRCEAPSMPIAELPPSLSEELRRMYRHDIQDTVTLWPHWPKDRAMTASFQDLSLAGCAIECPQTLTGNTVILLETTLLAAICQVRYCKPANRKGHYQAGLQFLTLEIRAQPGTVFSTVA